jgi:hypothetical protein
MKEHKWNRTSCVKRPLQHYYALRGSMGYTKVVLSNRGYVARENLIGPPCKTIVLLHSVRKTGF